MGCTPFKSNMLYTCQNPEHSLIIMLKCVFVGGYPTCACLNSEPSLSGYIWSSPACTGPSGGIKCIFLLHTVHKMINNNHKSRLELLSQNNLLISGRRGSVLFEFPVALLSTRHFTLDFGPARVRALCKNSTSTLLHGQLSPSITSDRTPLSEAFINFPQISPTT